MPEPPPVTNAALPFKRPAISVPHIVGCSRGMPGSQSVEDNISSGAITVTQLDSAAVLLALKRTFASKNARLSVLDKLPILTW
jgi:hypothetical protein